jgi:hypothetical protein
VPPLRSRDIKTNHSDINCDVCGRTLLRGERAEPFLVGGSRRQVCELCVNRAIHEGWIRESGAADELVVRPTRMDRRGRSLMGRLKARRERADELIAEPELDPALEAELADHPVVTERAPAPRAEPAGPASREPRHVRAVPTNAELKMERALDVFNGSEHPRTVAGVARSLGAPEVCVRTSDDQPSVVGITVMWELSWYRYEVDLSDEAGGARRAAQGAELDELPDSERLANASADAAGKLRLGA